jgi:hypothetical protein
MDRMFGAGAGWGRGPLPPNLIPDARRAVQSQRQVSPPYPEAEASATNWPAYGASLRQRGDLTVWFSEEAIAAWRAAPRTSRGGPPWYSPLAILTALTLPSST